MKNLLIVFAITIIPLTSYAENECLQKYKDSYQSKKNRYEKDYNRYIERRENALNAQLSGQITASSILGIAIIQNDTIPLKSDYNIYEHDIINAVEFELNSKKSKPRLLEEIYNESYESYSHVTYERIQSILYKGMQEKFCRGIFGKSQKDKIKKYVFSQLKKENSDSIYERKPAVQDSSYSFKEENFTEEVSRPNETFTRGVDE